MAATVAAAAAAAETAAAAGPAAAAAGADPAELAAPGVDLADPAARGVDRADPGGVAADAVLVRARAGRRRAAEVRADALAQACQAPQAAPRPPARHLARPGARAVRRVRPQGAGGRVADKSPDRGRTNRNDAQD